MRNVFVYAMLSAAISFASAGTVQAAGAQDAVTPSLRMVEERKAQLDELYSALKRQRSQAEATRIARNISTTLSDSGSASVDLMMGWASKAFTEKKFDQALDFLDQVIVLRPDFADGYYRRAMVHFAMEDFNKAMADIERAINYEPRHFGALTGLANVMETTGRDELALKAYERVLDIYPALRSAQDEVSRLADKLAGERA